ncbi:MAG TPA: hypothetical protein VL981_02255 [Candidatus Methylacidiphilales bacterium]|nr:hypothetical protein [Candidatus Methylacidiphilales bacterium]
MKMRTPFSVVLLLALGIGVSRGNLGETEAQCIARYGSETDLQDNLAYDVVGDKAVIFHIKTTHASLNLKVIFFNGVGSHEVFTNADAAGGLSEDQMKAILNSESGALKWNRRNSVYHTDRSGETFRTEDWLRSDGATAKFWLSGEAASGKLTGEIEVSTKEYSIAQRNLDKQDGANQ